MLPDVQMLVVSVRKGRVLEGAAACRRIAATVTLIAYCFTTGVVEHVVRCFAASLRPRLSILLYLQSFVKCPAFLPQTAQ